MADRISLRACSHGEHILANFRKEVWRADTSNCLFPPEAYLSDRLIKEILDRFLQLISLKAVKIFLQPYERLKHQEHGLFNVLQALKIVQAKSTCSWRAPVLSTKEVAASYGPQRTIHHRDI